MEKPDTIAVLIIGTSAFSLAPGASLPVYSVAPQSTPFWLYMFFALFSVYLLLTCNVFAQDNLDNIMQQRLLPAMNQLPTNAGLPPLTAGESRLTDSARLHLASFVQHGTIADQYEGEPSLTERLSIAKMPSGAAGEVMFNIHDANAPAEDLLKSEHVREVLLNPKFTKRGFAAFRSDPNTFVVIDLVQPLEMLPIEELEGRVVEGVNRVRIQQNIQPFKRQPMKLLRGSSCEMAKKDSLKIKPVDPYLGGYIGAPSSTFRSINYARADPGEIPAGVQTMAGDPKLDAVSVGACFGKSPTYPGGTYWIALLFYSKCTMNCLTR